MTQLIFEKVCYHYSDVGVRDLSFTLASGQVAALVGASGSGKSTTLKLIAGFLQPQSGTIRMDNTLIADAHTLLAPNKRKIGLVFQQHALFPHLNVTQNILFGCQDQGAVRAERLAKLLEDFRIAALAKRYPHEISGGEQQRVALARALAANPNLLLMDEPFASIDSVLRREIRVECVDILKKMGVTTLIVTHDAEEAMELADQIFVMDHGRLVQSGTAHDVYFHPINASVAGLFGEINRITDPALIRAFSHQARMPQLCMTHPCAAQGGDYAAQQEFAQEYANELLIRPEALEIACGAQMAPHTGVVCPRSAQNPAPYVEGVIDHTHFRGNHHILCVKTALSTMLLKVHVHQPVHAIGARVTIRLAA